MVETHDYPVTVEWRAGKEGTAEAVTLPALAVASPPEFGGPAGTWSPEHLFVASVASCYMTTFVAIASNSRLEFASLSVPAVGRLVRGEDRRYRIDRITLSPHLALIRGEDRDRAIRILEKAEQVCLISASIRSEVVLEPTLEVAPDPSVVSPLTAALSD
jgi:peroxiredoxin-like protein